MDAAYRSRLDKLFAEALELPITERAPFLAQTCTGDPTLRAQVEELLLLAGEQAPALDTGGLIGGPLWTALADELEPAAAVAPGTRAGPWRVLRELGHGGMGTVYLAERADGAFELRAALKLLRPEVHSEEALVRFEREREILARLHHPNVATLLDGGRMGDGRPFFVMEHVEGLPVDRYCDERRLGVDDRLALLLKVGRAVQHAHRHLVVHRDLKPSNIVVTGEGEVKLLDFGIAKLLAADGDLGSTLTQTPARILTPEYASPEQVLGQPITTASDVFQLGLLLYELLTGERAQRIDDSSSATLQRVVCEREPVRPSRVVMGSAEAAAARHTTPSALSRRLRGDLDTIVLMALRKEPERRYASVEQMVEDVERHRRGLPVRAQRDTVGYRTRKFVRRHALGVATAAGVGLLLVAYAATVTYQAGQLARERDRAQMEANKAKRVQDFLVGLFEAADPMQAKGEQVTAAELVDAGARQARSALAAEPALQAEMLGVLGVVLHGRAAYARAEPLLEEALAIQRRLHSGDHPDLARALAGYAEILAVKDYARSEQLARDALAMRRRLFDARSEEVAESLQQLSTPLSLQGRNTEAEALLREALSIRLALPAGDQGKAVAALWKGLGAQLAKQRKHAEAEAAYRAGLAIEEKLHPSGDPRFAAGLGTLAWTLNELGKSAEAEALYRRALEGRMQLFGPEHPLVSNVLHNLGELQRLMGRASEAAATHREALRIRRKAFGPKHSNVALSLQVLARSLHQIGQAKEAEALFREALVTLRDSKHWSHSHCEIGLGRLLVRTGRSAEADPLLADALATRIANDGETSAPADEARLALGLCRLAQGRTAEARDLLGPALERQQGTGWAEADVLAEAKAAIAALAPVAR